MAAWAVHTILCGFSLEIGAPLPKRSQSVHHSSVAERALGGGDVLGFPRPDPLRRCLQRSAVRKSYVPWQRTHPADGVKMRSRFLVRLPAGEECNARNSGWHAGLEHAHGFFGDLL